MMMDDDEAEKPFQFRNSTHFYFCEAFVLIMSLELWVTLCDTFSTANGRHRLAALQ